MKKTADGIERCFTDFFDNIAEYVGRRKHACTRGCTGGMRATGNPGATPDTGYKGILGSTEGPHARLMHLIVSRFAVRPTLGGFNRQSRAIFAFPLDERQRQPSTFARRQDRPLALSLRSAQLPTYQSVQSPRGQAAQALLRVLYEAAQSILSSHMPSLAKFSCNLFIFRHCSNATGIV